MELKVKVKMKVKLKVKVKYTNWRTGYGCEVWCGEGIYRKDEEDKYGGTSGTGWWLGKKEKGEMQKAY